MRGFVRFLVLLVVVAAIAYLGAWWYVQGRLALAFHQQEQQLRKAGWTVTHASTARGSSPLLAQFSVVDLTLTPPSQQGLPTVTINLPNFALRVRPVAPFTLDIGLPLTWHLASAGEPAFTAQFTSIHDRFRFDPNALLNHGPYPLRTVVSDVRGMRFDTAGTNFTLVSVGSFTAHNTLDPTAGKSATFEEVHGTLTGLAVSPIFVSLAHLPFDGKIASLRLDADLSGPRIAMFDNTAGPALTPVDPSPAATWRRLGPVIHDWAKAGGHATISLAVALGPLKATETGQFGFDQTVQPDLKAVLVADGMGAFLGDIGNSYPAAVGMISALTARSAPYMAKGPDGHQRLTVNFALAGGVLTANGQKAADVPPVVWPKASH